MALIKKSCVQTIFTGNGTLIDPRCFGPYASCSEKKNAFNFIEKYLQPELIQSIAIELSRAPSCNNCTGGKNCTSRVKAEIFYYNSKKKQVFYVGHDSEKVVSMLQSCLNSL